jgi:hypothetical protein
LRISEKLSFPFNFAGVGDHDLDVTLGGEVDFIRARRVERVGQRHLHRAVAHSDRQTFIHPRDFGRNRFDQFGRDFAVAQRHDFRAEISGHYVQDVILLHDAEVLQDLEHGRVAALELGDDLLVLEVVNHALLFDERQQRI